MQIKPLHLLISGGAIALAAAHVAFPGVDIDAVVIALLAIALAPWLAPIIESLELPGGWKIKYRDVQAAGEKVVAGSDTPAATEVTTEIRRYLEVAGQDANLALVQLRIEIERRLRKIAEKNGIVDSRRSLLSLVRDLQRRDIVTGMSMMGLQELIMFGNQAAHGATVDPRAAGWALEAAPEILGALDAKMGE